MGGKTGHLFQDARIFEAVLDHEKQEQTTINLIASENYVSAAVREAQGSVLTNKYAEGYPGSRWYNGCRYVDAVERTAVERAKELFGAEHVNVQPHCGSTANMAVYFAALKPGDTITAMSLAHGGHLTHGHELNFSGRLFNIVSYGVARKDGRIDYDRVDEIVKEHRPKLLVAGASAYPREIDFSRFRETADSVGAMLLVDMAHIAGLVAGKAHPSPIGAAEFVTATTHKTLRGPRGGLVFCGPENAPEIDRQIFPGLQGGPEMHTIAAKGVCFGEALQPAFGEYARNVVRNAGALAEKMMSAGYRLVSGGTDNHLMLVDLSSSGITGKKAADALEEAGIIANKNSIPYDTKPPAVTSGIRLGTAAVTTRGMKDTEMALIAGMIDEVLSSSGDGKVIAKTREKSRELARAFPTP
ncbi:MAG: serine hydroxymethyltransferase [Kiritimatiellia bacterium]